MSELAMRGFILKTMAKWQMEHHMMIKEGDNMTPQQRITAAKEQANYVKEFLVMVLRNKTDENMIHNGVDTALTGKKLLFL